MIDAAKLLEACEEAVTHASFQPPNRDDAACLRGQLYAVLDVLKRAIQESKEPASGD